MPDIDEPNIDGHDEADEVPAKRSMGVVLPALIAIVLVGFVVIVLATREPAANRVVDSPLVGRAAPAIEGTTLEGDQFSLADERGQFTLVNFFATWCVPCQREHDDLVRFDRRHRGVDASVLSVVFQDDTEEVRDFFAENGGEFPVIAGDNGDIALDFGVGKVPESFLIGPDGTVVAKIIGGVTDEGLDDLLLRFQGEGGG